jgi:hypothetical protein
MRAKANSDSDGSAFIDPTGSIVVRVVAHRSVRACVRLRVCPNAPSAAGRADMRARVFCTNMQGRAAACARTFFFERTYVSIAEHAACCAAHAAAVHALRRGASLRRVHAAARETLEQMDGSYFEGLPGKLTVTLSCVNDGHNGAEVRADPCGGVPRGRPGSEHRYMLSARMPQASVVALPADCDDVARPNGVYVVCTHLKVRPAAARAASGSRAYVVPQSHPRL